MKLDNVVLRRRNGIFGAYYDGEDAPLLVGVGYTKECAIHDLYKFWHLHHELEAL